MKPRQLIHAAALLILISTAALADPLGTAFTYQGRLDDAGKPAGGLYDLRFTLYDARAGGGALGTNTLTAAVTSGSFTATLDFGAIFTGDARWLELSVRTNGAVDYTTLAPRQALTPTPYAAYAPSAGVAASAASVAAANITGALTPGQLPGGVLTNGASAVYLSGTFTGNAAGLSNLPATALASGFSSWTEIVGWGDNSDGQATSPVGLTNVTAVAVGANHSLALRSDGTVVAWGANDGLERYYGDDGNVYSFPVYYGQATVPDGLMQVTAIAAGGYHSLALKSDGTVVGWGGNDDGWGNSTGQATVPDELMNVAAIAAGYVHSLSLKSDGTVVGWGDNSVGQLNVPGGLTNVTAIAAGEHHSLALLGDGTVVGWGQTNFGQVEIPAGLRFVVALATGGSANHALAIRHLFLAPVISVDGVISGNGVIAGAFAGDGGGLINLNAGNLAAGTVSDARLSGNVALRNADQVFTGNNRFDGVTTLTNAANAFAGQFSGTFSGNGAGLTNLNSLQLTGPLTCRAAGGLNWVGGYDTPGYANGVAVAGHYAYVADMDAGLQVIDISNPAHPQWVGGYDTADWAVGVAVVTNYAYVADGYSGLQVIDISNPAHPQWVGGYDTADYAMGVAVAGNYAYVADMDAGLQAIDISGPANPQRVGGYDTPGAAWGVAVAGNYAYVADGGSGLQVLAIEPVASMAGIVMLANAANTFNGLFSGNAAGLTNLNASQLTTGTLPLAQLPAPVLTNGAFAVNLTGNFTGNFTGNAGGLTNLDSLQLTGPLTLRTSDPVLLGDYEDFDGAAIGVAVADNYAYLADGWAGLQVMDIGNPANPQWIGSFVTFGYACGVAVAGHYAYLADGTNGLLVINISNPASPQGVGGYHSGGCASGVAVAGHYAYVADQWVGLQVIDVSDPNHPHLVGGCATADYAMGVAVAGNYAYVADELAGLQVIDISNPANPQRVGGYDTPGVARGVAVAGNYAYVADSSAGLQVIDISNPANPQRVGGCDTGGYAEAVAVAGNYAYVADYDAGLQVLAIGPVASMNGITIFNGPVSIGKTNPSNAMLTVVNARCDGSSWINASDRNLKQSFAPVDAQAVLDKVAALPVQTWSYKAQPGEQHLGPVAQDFRAAFGLGADDVSIATVDETGVALAAIQGLNRKLQEEIKLRDQELEKIRAELAELKRLVHARR